MLVLALAAAISACPVQDEVLTAAADRIESGYLDAGSGGRIAIEVRRWRDTGRYHAECADSAGFARRFQRDLGVFDGHFLVEGPRTETAPDNWLTAWRASAGPANAGVREVRVLEGNVGYMRLTSFYSWDLAQKKLESAFELVSDARALILDFRHNGGGDGATAGQVLRALMPADVDSVMWIERRDGRTVDTLPEGLLRPLSPSVPIVVLIDRRTGSAAEAITYALQSHGRARIVGDRSGGAAHMLGEPQPLPHGFSLGVPEARPVDMKTASNWEQTGVIPDVRGGDDALFVARQLLAAP